MGVLLFDFKKSKCYFNGMTLSQKQQVEVIENIKNRRQVRSIEILEETRLIRKKITESSGKWDAVKVLRDIRYAD